MFIVCCWHAPLRRLNHQPPEFVSILSGKGIFCPSETARPVRNRRVPREHFTCHDKGVSHAEWRKDKHENAPAQTRSINCCPAKAVDTECRPH
jgi:hypothetical protein